MEDCYKAEQQIRRKILIHAKELFASDKDAIFDAIKSMLVVNYIVDERKKCFRTAEECLSWADEAVEEVPLPSFFIHMAETVMEWNGNTFMGNEALDVMIKQFWANPHEGSQAYQAYVYLYGFWNICHRVFDALWLIDFYQTLVPKEWQQAYKQCFHIQGQGRQALLLPGWEYYLEQKSRIRKNRREWFGNEENRCFLMYVREYEKRIGRNELTKGIRAYVLEQSEQIFAEEKGRSKTNDRVFQVMRVMCELAERAGQNATEEIPWRMLKSDELPLKGFWEQGCALIEDYAASDEVVDLMANQFLVNRYKGEEAFLAYLYMCGFIKIAAAVWTSSSRLLLAYYRSLLPARATHFKLYLQELEKLADGNGGKERDYGYD